MTVKTLVQYFILLLCAVGLFFLASFLLYESVASFDKIAPYFQAPIIIDEAGFAGHDNKIVWLYGELAPQDGKSTIRGFLSETSCLYYQYQKLQSSWETDSEGDSYEEWTLIDSKIMAVNTVLKIGARKVALVSDGAVYYNLQTSTDFNKTIDGIDFNFREFIIPVESKAWVLGKLENGGIGKTDRGLFVSLSSPDSLIRYFKEESVIFLFLSILSFIAGAGFLGVFIVRLLQNRKMFLRPIDVGMFFGNLGSFWILTCIIYISFSQGTLFDSILSGIFMGVTLGGFIIPPLISVACRPRFVPFLIFFPPAIGLVILGSYFLYGSVFALIDWLLPLILGILCLAGAVTLVQIYRLIIARAD